jgi:hypothetical protein
MAFTNSNDYLNGRKQVPTPAGGENITVRFPLAVTAGDLALNTIGQVGWLPAGCVPVDLRVGGTDVDSGAAAMVLQVGIWDGSSTTLSTAAADGGAHWGVTTATNVAFDQALTRNGNAMQTIAPSASDRRLGVRVATAPTTPVAGTLFVEMTYRAALST